jgi:hypothetical protein
LCSIKIWNACSFMVYSNWILNRLKHSLFVHYRDYKHSFTWGNILVWEHKMRNSRSKTVKIRVVELPVYLSGLLTQRETKIKIRHKIWYRACDVVLAVFHFNQD